MLGLCSEMKGISAQARFWKEKFNLSSLGNESRDLVMCVGGQWTNLLFSD